LGFGALEEELHRCVLLSLRSGHNFGQHAARLPSGWKLASFLESTPVGDAIHGLFGVSLCAADVHSPRAGALCVTSTLDLVALGSCLFEVGISFAAGTHL